MKREWQFYSIVILMLDVVSITLSNVLSVWFRFNPGFFNDMDAFDSPGSGYYTMLLLIIPIFIIISAGFKLYRMTNIRDTFLEFGKVLLVNLLGALVLMSLTFITKTGLGYSRFVLIFFIAFNIVISNLFRWACRFYIRRMYKHGYFQKRIAVVGTGLLAEAYINSIKDYTAWGYKLEGIILTDENKKQTGFLGHKVIGCIGDLQALNQEYSFDELIVALHLNETPRIKEILKICDLEGIRVKIIPVYYEYLQVSASMEEINGLSMMAIRSIPLDSIVNRFIKRTFDMILSLLAIIILSPILVLVALGVKITSPGPVFFRQERVGLNNNTFDMLKFRSMRVQSDEQDKKQWTTAKDDPRKTRFGSLIRRLNLDELPQLFNVFIGDMSIVGPRPERTHWVHKLKSEIPEYMLRHYVKSGITGWAQINGWRGDTSIEERIKCDNYYIQNWSLWLDIKICLLTFVKAFSKNAY